MVEAKKLNVGIIGAGSISKKHLQHYSQNPNVNLIAISDLNEALAREKAEEFGLSYYTTDYTAYFYPLQNCDRGPAGRQACFV